MATLSDNGFNRFIYRDNGNMDTTDPINSAYGDIGSNQTGTGGSGTPVPGAPSGGIIPGSPPVKDVLLQSSSSGDRVEINPSDNFFAYNTGNIVVTINKNGINADNINVDNINADNINVDTTNIAGDFTYHGELQPIVYASSISPGGVGTNLPSGWSSFIVFPTLVYTVTHNLGHTNYRVVATPITGHYRGKVLTKTTTEFTITYQVTNYVTKVFSVTGGGGGTVTVTGVRDTVIPEILIASAFDFVLLEVPV